MMGTRLEFSSALTGITTAKEELRAQIAADVAAWERKNGKIKTMPIVRSLSDKGSFNNQQKATDAQKRVMAILRENPGMMKDAARKLCECKMSTLESAAMLAGYKFHKPKSLTSIVEKFAKRTKTSFEIAEEAGLDVEQVRTVLAAKNLPYKKSNRWGEA